ncbi:MAG: beta-glucosidase H [Candidatus Sumerlaeia bacterium]
MHSKYRYFKKPSPKIEKRIEGIVSKLTIEEKIDLLGGENSGTKSIPKKGVPQIKFADGPVGVHWWCDTSTAYPATIAAASSFDKDLLYDFGKAIGRDCRARGVHVLLAPGVNIYRSPLCGRNFEYMGEDPCLSSKMVVPYIKGCQDQGVSVTVKHYALNFQEYDRHGVSSDVDERTLREIYLPAFRAAIVEGGAGALMTAYNLVNGLHCSEHEYLNVKVLREEWGFDGVVMSDWTSVYDTVGPANGGLDLEMPHAVFMTREKLIPAIEKGLVTEETINDKIRNIMRLAACFGWLDREQQDKSIPLEDESSAQVALNIARKGSVLLKNSRNFLPLSDSVKKIAVIGPNADPAVICAGGSAYTTPWRVTSILEGIQQQAPEGTEIIFSKGVDPWRDQTVYANTEFRAPNNKRGLKVEFFENTELKGKPKVTQIDKQLDYHWGGGIAHSKLKTKDFSVRWTGSIQPERNGEHLFYAHGNNGIFELKLDGKVVMSIPEEENGLVIDKVILKGGKKYKFEATFVPCRPFRGCHFGYEHASVIEEARKEALKVAKEADAVIFCTGHGPRSEGEGHDRTFGMNPDVEEFLLQVADKNKNTAVVLIAGGNVDMQNWLTKIKALLMAWYPGQEGGTAVGEILFGKVNPSGKLPATFEKKWEDRSSYDNYHLSDENRPRNTAVDKRVRITDGVFTGYRHFDQSRVRPQFPFGFGLSYTDFEYSKFKLSKKTMKKEENLTVSFNVTNTGKVAGAEVAQMYISDLEASVPRPIKELKDFVRVELEPGETKEVSIEITPGMLAFYDMDWENWVVEKGDFEVLIGASAEDIRLQGKFAFHG